jgi:L-threonylcarbamoyladenylate synthase
MGIVSPSKKTIAVAVELLKKGELVAFPTETVYGLGADASNPEAVKKIFAAKGRPVDHPVIVHLARRDMLETWAKDIPALAHSLAEAFWPGPMTLILKRSSHVPDVITGSQDTVGLRVPAHLVALALLEAFGGGIAAPSANRFGRISPTSAQHVNDELDAQVRLILDGGDCQVGLESTIVDVTSEKFRILRPGGVNLEDLADILGYVPEVVTKPTMRVSGTLESHYAPRTPAYLQTPDKLETPGVNSGVNSGVLSLKPQPKGFDGVWLTLPSDPKAYAYRLYAVLRELDDLGLESILIEHVPDTPEWLAVRDRLSRATIKS